MCIRKRDNFINNLLNPLKVLNFNVISSTSKWRKLIILICTLILRGFLLKCPFYTKIKKNEKKIIYFFILI